jgi:tetratricopeptide (TPR) repeat protein
MGRAPVAEAAPDEERAAARSLAQQGSEAFSAKRFADAVDMFERAESLIHSPVHLLYIARASVELGRLVKAQEAYIKISREQLAADAPAAFEKAVDQANAELEALRPRIASAKVKISGAEQATPQLLVDGQPVPAVLVGVPIPLDPGTHHFEARADGMTSAAADLTVAEGHQGELELVLVPAPSSAAASQPSSAVPAPPAHDAAGDGGNGDILRYSAYGAFGLGAVGIGLGTVFALDASKKSKDADDRFAACKADGSCEAVDTEISAIDDDAATSRGIAITGFVVGGVGIAAGITLLVLAAGEDDDVASVSPQVRPWIGWGSAGLSGTF